MPLVTFFSVLELPEKNRKEQTPLVRRGLMTLKIGCNCMLPTCSLNRCVDFGIQKGLNYFKMKEEPCILNV